MAAQDMEGAMPTPATPADEIAAPAVPEGTPPTDASATPAPEGEQQPIIENPAAVLKALNTERDSHDRVAKELRAAQAQLAAIEEAKLTDEEKVRKALETITAERDQLVRDAQQATATTALTAAATAAGAVNANAIARLIGTDGLTFDDAGAVSNAEALVTAAAATYPELFGTPATPLATGPQLDGGRRTPPAPTDLKSQIAELEAKGDHKAARALKAQQLLSS